MSVYALVLGLPSRVRAMSLLHALPPPDVAGARGLSDQGRRLARAFPYRGRVSRWIKTRGSRLAVKVILHQTILGLAPDRSAILPV